MCSSKISHNVYKILMEILRQCKDAATATTTTTMMMLLFVFYMFHMEILGLFVCTEDESDHKKNYSNT